MTRIVTGRMIMRKPALDDYPEILQLLDRAFAPSTYESILVRKLREVGDPNYYARFGFKIDKTQKCSFDPSGEHFMVISQGSPLPARDVGYEEEFIENN